ncbi:MAG: serine/threonine protein kinase [Microbacterium sp.]|nr:serine/threonine protein kinase [Microbacterium sp.]
MSARRAPAAPPDLPGFTYVDLLGSGGFADVYLYEQHLPKRRVAVKVLLTDRMSSGSVSEFTSEANVMAMLSTHPAIVTIYQAGVAADGRPYLVMEYCPKPNLQVRYRREPFSIAESLRVGVQVAAAVETAHRAGVLHRDIKPANILVTEYNRPALTDFGIASTTSAAAESAGLSIPWSPPESFADAPRSDPRSDVWALGATVYTLLAGRSPFELQGQRNSAADLIQRIETSPLPPLGRPDAPVSLSRALERAMAKNAADRYPTALDLARAFQKVQIELAHAVTPIDILDDGVPDDIVEDEDDGLTRVRGVVSIDPETAPAAGLTRPAGSPLAPAGAAPAAPAPMPTFNLPADTVRRGTTASPAAAPAAPSAPVAGPSFLSPDVDETMARIPDAAPAPEPDVPAAPPSRRGMWAAISAGAFLVLVAVVVAVTVPAMLSGGADPTPSSSSTVVKPVDPIPVEVGAPSKPTGTKKGGEIVWTWKDTDKQEGDTFLWRDVTRADQPGATRRVAQPTVTTSGATTCIEVITRRTDGTTSAPVTGCTS